jgi:hypothetical protein
MLTIISFPYFILAMIGFLVIIIVICMYNEEKAMRKPKARVEPNSVAKQAEIFISKLETKNGTSAEAGKKFHEQIHKELNEAVQFTQNLINNGL